MKVPPHIRLGQSGEMQAREYLTGQGYKILSTNWTFEKAEVDIIAEKEGEVIFAEVKTRRTAFFGYPEVSVDKRKQMHLQRAAEAYLLEKNLSCSIRFDIISIVQEPAEIFHIEDAFFPFDSI
jgi:putative endonuclease